MRPEYDFTEGVQGKHSARYRQGHVVCVRKEGSRVTLRYFKERTALSCWIRTSRRGSRIRSR